MQLLFCVLLNIACLCLLWVSCYPGWFNDFLIIPMGLAIVGFLGMYAWLKANIRKNRPQPLTNHYLVRLPKATKWVLVITLLLLLTNLMQYVAFILSQPALKNLERLE